MTSLVLPVPWEEAGRWLPVLPGACRMATLWPEASSTTRKGCFSTQMTMWNDLNSYQSPFPDTCDSLANTEIHISNHELVICDSMFNWISETKWNPETIVCIFDSEHDVEICLSPSFVTLRPPPSLISPEIPGLSHQRLHWRGQCIIRPWTFAYPIWRQIPLGWNFWPCPGFYACHSCVAHTPVQA